MGIRLIRVKHLKLTLGYMGIFFNKGSMTMKLHILKVLYGLESYAKDGKCGLSRNEYIRRCVGKLVEKQTLACCAYVCARARECPVCLYVWGNRYRVGYLCLTLR